MAISGGIGQFAGNVPLIGHNIQKNSLNVALRKCIPDDVVRSCVMQFGTKGLFGKARLRTVQHDRDNVVKKNYRARKSLRCRPTSRRKTEGPLPARDAPKSEYVPVERILVFPPSPLPSPVPSFSTSFSPPTPPVRGEHGRVIPTEGPVVCDNSVDPRPVALSPSGCNGMLPVSDADTDSNNRSSSLSSLSSRPGGAYPTWGNSLTGAFSYHDLAMASPSQYDTRTDQHRTSVDTRSAASMSTSGAHITDAPSTTKLAGSDGMVDKFTCASAVIPQVNSQMCVAPGVEQAVTTPIRTEPIVDQGINTMENLNTHDHRPHHGTPCPTSNAPQCAPDSQFAGPFAASDPAGSSSRGQVPSPSNHFAGLVAFSGLEPNGTLPTSADSNSHTPSPPRSFNASDVAYPRPGYSSPTGAIIHHDLTAVSSQRDAPAYQSFNARYATLVLTADKLRDDARHAAHLVGSRAVVDVSTKALTFTGEVNSQIPSPTRPEHALKAHVNAHIAEGFLPTYGLPQSQSTRPYPALNTARDPSRSNYPLAAFVDPESPSDPDRSPFNHFAGPGVAHSTWYSPQTTTDPYASEVGTPIARYAAVPVSTRRDASSVPDYTPLDSGYTASLRSSAGHECVEHSVTLPQIAHSPFPVSSSHGATLNTLPLSYDTATNNSPSSSLANALGNHDTQPSGIPYHGVDGAVPSARSVRTFGPINASTSAREITWQMIPDPGFAPVASQTVDDLFRGRPGPDANASRQCAQCIASEVSHAHWGLESCFDAYSPSGFMVAHDPVLGPRLPRHRGKPVGRWCVPKCGPRLTPPPALLPPPPGANRAEPVDYPYTPYGLCQ